MRSDWCVVVRPRDTASTAEVERLGALFRAGVAPLDVTFEGADVLVLVADASSLSPVEAAVSDVLMSHDLGDAIVTPLPIGRWDEKLGRYLIVDARAPAHPAEWTDEVRWAVTVRPTSVFDWRAVRAALNERGRPMLRESSHEIDVAARDEADARTLIADLLRLPAVDSAEAVPMSWFRRWRVRQQLFGNYSDGGDPSQPG
jgi:hypothetical protein